MEAIKQIESLLLKKYTSPTAIGLVDTSILYVKKKIAETKKNEHGQYVKAYSFDADFLLQAIAECVDNGFALDGINYTLTGNRMYMPTYHAFKNKIYMVYPESQIDVQLIREGDEYSFGKESGSVVYSHTVGDPFTSVEPKIKGAYCVIRNSRGEFLETLNLRDYTEMKNSSKNPRLWDKWASEFWLKSVIKRACKRHFHDITKSIDEKDNEVIGLADMVKATDDKKAAIIAAAKGTDDGDQDTRNTAE